MTRQKTTQLKIICSWPIASAQPRLYNTCLVTGWRHFLALIQPNALVTFRTNGHCFTVPHHAFAFTYTGWRASWAQRVVSLRAPDGEVSRVWNVMAHAQKPDFVFRRNGRVHLNRWGRQFSRLLAADVCASGVSNAGYTMFRGSVKNSGYPLHSPVSPSLPLPCVTVCHHISTGLYDNTRKATVSFVLSIIEQLGSYWAEFHQIW
jgi:hypothetical protein